MNNTRSVRISAVVICTYCEASNRFRRFIRSAITPPTSENKMMGDLRQESIQAQIEGIAGEIVYQLRPCGDCIHVPMVEGVCAYPHQPEITMLETFEDAAKQETPVLPKTRF